jgi:hypothetical protein
MSYADVLKEKILAALEYEHSDAILEQVNTLLSEPAFVSAEVEARLDKAFESVKAGKTMSLDTFLAHSEEQDAKRNARYGQ